MLFKSFRTYTYHPLDKKVTEDSRSIFYFIKSHNKTEILAPLIAIIDKIRQDIVNLINNKEQKNKNFAYNNFM